MNQQGNLSREEPFSFASTATINAGASTTPVYGALANTKPIDALFLNAAAAATLQFQDQANNAVSMVFATAGTYIVPISPSSIQTTGTTVTNILALFK